ncbi:MAG: hypothetical protein GX660_23830 [Clostridiaceae bacterium]|nr:hypothetical protein [Clostridiaceae bacterium]
MKKLAIIILLLVILVPNNIQAEDSYVNPSELIGLANKEIINMGLLNDDYFKPQNINGKKLIES